MAFVGKGGARNEVPVGEPGKAVLWVERPSTCNCGQRSFNRYVRRPAEVHRAMSAKDWSRFAWEMSQISDRFWNELFGVVPILMILFGFMPLLAFMSGAFSLDMPEHKLITSDGSFLLPHCSWEKECVWNIAVELACTSRLCRSAGFNYGMLISSSNDMCRSTFSANISKNTHHVFWDSEKNWGPHLYDKSTGHGLAVISADCVLKHPPPAWGASGSVLAMFPFVMAFVIFPMKALNSHNGGIDREISDLVFQANSAMPSRTGCRIEYSTDFTGLCKPKGVRPWRAVIVYGDPGQQGHLQHPPSERIPLTV